MSQKSKIAPEEKIRVVQEYLSGHLRQSDFTGIYGIGSQRLYEWVRIYKARGAEGLIPSTTNRKYSLETKRMAVEEYLSGSGSLNDVCAQYGISDRKVLRQWIKRYNSHEDFRQPNSGGTIYMRKGRKTTWEERIDIVSHCIANNRDYGKTIEEHRVSYQQIYGWVRKYEKDGAGALDDHRGKRKEIASMSEVEKLRAQLKLREAENLRLQMENEVLKKLEALERGQDEG